jgi:peptidyl-prolyl cis-trans isomerase SurA
MKIRQVLTIFIIFLNQGSSFTQTLNDKVLLTVGNQKVTSGEFIRMYKKSFDTTEARSIDDYLKQYIDFKLKVEDAISAGIDTTRAFRTELQGYRDQLAQNYLTDNDAREKLLQKAYQRYLIELNGWHILVNCPLESKPEDTLKAWKKARDIRERIIQGEPFEQVARSSSDDPSVKINGGNLGFFTAFQMIMPFEDAAYNLKIGEISQPVRSPYGYHIITVKGKRPSQGKIKVAHIMKALSPGASDEEQKNAEDVIRDVYKQLQAGASFSDLAKKYSDHKESSPNGGELNWFSAGEIITDFAEPALALKKNGDYTSPVRTYFGWHIIKRLDKKEPGSYIETKPYLESKLNTSYLNSIGKQSLIEKLKKEYRLNVNTVAFNWFITHTDTMIIMGKARYNRAEMPSGNIYTFANQQFTTREFASFLEKRGQMISTRDSSVFITESLNTRITDHILSYEDANLEKKYPEFKYLVNEFHDGILLFEISGRKVWNKAQDDSSGIKNYYERNKQKFLTKEKIAGTIYTLRKSDGMKSLEKAFKTYSKDPNKEKKLVERFIKKRDSLLTVKKGIWEKGENKYIDSLDWKKNEQKAIIDGFPSIIIVNKIIEGVPLPLREVRGEVIAGFQQELETDWIKQLKNKFAVKIDNGVLEDIRQRIKNE